MDTRQKLNQEKVNVLAKVLNKTKSQDNTNKPKANKKGKTQTLAAALSKARGQ